jgi:isoamylase
LPEQRNLLGDWSHDERGQALTRFVKRLTGLRRHYAVLRQSHFLTAQWNEELDLKESTWLAPTGEEMTPEQCRTPPPAAWACCWTGAPK